MIGAFLWFGASQALLAARMAERVPECGSILCCASRVVPPELPLSQALRWAREQAARAIVVLDGDHRPVAVVADAMLAGVPEAQRPWRPVSSVAVALDPRATTAAASGRLGADGRLPAASGGVLLALDGHGVPAGVVAALDVRRFLENPPGAVVQA
jgi:hypothetical protein